MAPYSRRQFLKILGLAGTAGLSGCSERVRHLVPYVIPPEDIVPGDATWYASTCRECPAGCGMLVKNRDGHVIKVEGNPLHPVNEGKLCARGQASVQGLYNPDRYKGPMRAGPRGRMLPVSWEEAEQEMVARLSEGNRKGGLIFLTNLVTGAEEELIRQWAEAAHGEHVMYEPFAYEGLRRANRVVFGTEAIPDYRIDRSDFLISFGAGFLETWISNVRLARQFAAFHEPKDGKKNCFVYVGPRLSLTAANADYWVQVPPGGESIVALGLLRLLAREAPAASRTERLFPAISAITPTVVEERTGVKPDVLSALARRILMARRPLALAEGTTFQDPHALETAVAANLLCALSPDCPELLDFSNPASLGRVIPAAGMKALVDRMSSGDIRALLIYRANPAFNLPPSWGFEAALRKVPTVISFSSLPDETSRLAGLLMPSHTFLESWGEYSPNLRITGLSQPVMGSLFSTRPLGDMLLSSGKKLGKGEAFQEKDFYEVLRKGWDRRRQSTGSGPEAFWQESLKRGGMWGPEARMDERRRSSGELSRHETPFAFSVGAGPSSPRKAGTFDFICYPTIQFFDGRMANRPFLLEMPDPVTMVTWDGWVEINPETAKAMHIAKGDVIVVRAGEREIRAPAFPYWGVPANALAMPIGQGHDRTFSRYVTESSGNPAQLLSGLLDPAEGLLFFSPGVTIEKTGQFVPLANTDGSSYQHDRGIAQSLSQERYSAIRGQSPRITMPLPSGFDEKRDFYPPHEHVDYRWAMAIDLDRCIGCQACVAACYAENNVAIVGKANTLKGREMSWLHIERYFEPAQPYVRFLPMLCQHCDEAPCESVCPVFAPNHSKEGINNQVYNRCIGTRFCNQNCPYKVRRFNWFTFAHDSPLEWQLNPDVTVRQKGVMEKCSFCIQRIVKAKAVAVTAGRKVRDNEFTTACAQTCPVDAITFGNLMDPKSAVSLKVKEARAYQVLGHLNTKSAVIYLKKITQELEG